MTARDDKPKLPAKVSDQAENDFEFSRQTYYDLILKGQEALDEMLMVAKSTEHPRSYEVVAGLIKNISDVNDRLMDNHKKNKDLKAPNKFERDENDRPAVAFVGTTSDLQRMLQKAHEENMVDITADSDER